MCRLNGNAYQGPKRTLPMTVFVRPCVWHKQQWRLRLNIIQRHPATDKSNNKKKYSSIHRRKLAVHCHVGYLAEIMAVKQDLVPKGIKWQVQYSKTLCLPQGSNMSSNRLKDAQNQEHKANVYKNVCIKYRGMWIIKISNTNQIVIIIRFIFQNWLCEIVEYLFVFE